MPKLVILLGCPACSGSTQDPECPEAVRDDVGTCLVCCDPSRPAFIRPGTIDAAAIWRDLEADSLDAACSHGLSSGQVFKLRDTIIRKAIEHGLVDLGALVARLIADRPWPTRGTFTDRATALVEDILRAH